MSQTLLRAEFAAVVLKVTVVIGDQVQRDQEILVLESMKTEIPITSPAAGRIVEIRVGEGDAVEERQPLVVLET